MVLKREINKLFFRKYQAGKLRKKYIINNILNLNTKNIYKYSKNNAKYKIQKKPK